MTRLLVISFLVGGVLGFLLWRNWEANKQAEELSNELIQRSNEDYGRIYEIGASEFQQVPELTQLPPPAPLQPGELFVPILMYHHIRINPRPGDPVWAALNVTPAQLDQQLGYLAAHNFHTIDLDQLVAAFSGKERLPDNPVVLTFDDGYRNFYENAFPLLEKYNMKAVEFVITGAVDAQASLTWAEIEEMDRSGLVQFGTHTRHHPNLPDVSQKTIIDEVSGSKSDLEAHLHHPVNFFAYPYGSYNNFIIQAVKDAGFLGAVSTIYGPVQSKNRLFLMPRIMVDGRFSLDNLVRRITR